MRAAILLAPRQFSITDLPTPEMGPRDVLARPTAVGICGTDFHIFEGQANYNYDPQGRPVPLEQSPQVLGHEIAAVIERVGKEVDDLRVGDRVVVDQGWNCFSQGRTPCEYCATGDLHQCEFYLEQGISGIPGGMAELLRVPAVNAVRVAAHLPVPFGAMTEPLACILHALELAQQTYTRYTLPTTTRPAPDNPVRTALICGAGPAGLLFLQCLRGVLGFTGPVLVVEPNSAKRALVVRFGGEAIDPGASDLVTQVLERTAGRGVEFLVDAAGYGPLYKDIPGMLRKQGTLVMYGHGHHSASLGLMNALQYREARLVAATGASGGFDARRRPRVYQRALQLLEEEKIVVSPLITHQYDGLPAGLAAFQQDRFLADYIKGVITFS
ncbi:MAG: zinc-dependent alcohol dehydrogenase [Terriglobales bacterium]